jgi:Raf kinase inhibitor-like YbhB/YbcL family protein
MNLSWLAAGVLFAAAAGTRGGARLTVESSAFPAGAAIPRRHTCDGDDLSPALSWSGAPPSTREFAVVCDDPDAPGGTFTHWVLWGISANVASLPEGIAPGDRASGLGTALQGSNGFRVRGYRGPCPPPGKAHHYRFRVYALSERIDLPAGSPVERLRAAMSGRIAADGEIVGTYGR